MGKQKQQVISRFFAPKPKTSSTSTSLSPPESPFPPSSSFPNPSTPPPKITATVTFSPSKRVRSSQLTPHDKKPPKFPKLSPHTHNSVPSFIPNSPSSRKTPPEPPAQKPTKNPKLSPHTQNPIPPQPNPFRHRKFLNKLLEPSPDILEPGSASKVPISNPKYTPLEQQVVDLKAKYPDVLLMVEVGYKYRFFGEDAENAARILGIYAHMDHNFLTASVPTFRLNVHVRRLVSAGYKVGVVKQTETAAIKAHGSNRLGPFSRGLSALYTKATLEVTEDVGGGEEKCGSCNNYLVCVVEKKVVVQSADHGMESGNDVRIGFVAVEISTGDVVYGEFDDNFMRAGLEAMLLSLSPAELLLGEPLSKQTEKLLLAYAGPASNARVEHATRESFSSGGALAEVMSVYENLNENHLLDDHDEQDTNTTKQGNNRSAIEGIMVMPDSTVQALALIVRHLKQYGFEKILCLGASFRPFSSNMEMTLSANALQQLEILKNNSDASESGSLFKCMNHTLTIFGTRLLRHWITHPLCDRNMISARLDAVSDIAESMGSCKIFPNSEFDEEGSDVTTVRPGVYHLISSVLTTLGRSPDIQRGIARIFHQTATASEFIAVIQAILLAGKQLQQLGIEEDGQILDVQPRVVHSVLLRKLILTASSSNVLRSAAELLSSLNKEAADQRDLPNLFINSDGQFSEVSRARATVQLAKDNLGSLIGLYRQRLGMHSLHFMSVSGTTHLIELPVDVKVPLNWVKINSTKKTIRYHPPEVVAALDQLSLADEELTLTCRVAWDNFLKAFGRYYAEFQAAVQALAALDCLHSLAILSRNKNYVRPIFVDDSEPAQIHICSGRHPVMETLLPETCVPNDTVLHADRESCQIITGPNMGGKSCYIRQVALIAIMAQIGSFVPASSAKLNVLDGIYTRMGASDSIQQGRSTFLEELSEASHILDSCTARSLVIIDELGRGTSTHDGVAIAYATLHHLLEQKRCMVLFVTHYPKIVDIKNEFPGSVGAYHVSYLTSQENTEMHSNTALKADCVIHEDVIYLYKLVPGVSQRSFGLKVAQLAQIPSSCIRLAFLMATKLEVAIGNREQDRLEQKFVKGSVQISKKEEGLEELSNAYREFFADLKILLFEDIDSVKKFHFLARARRLAIELLDRNSFSGV